LEFKPNTLAEVKQLRDGSANFEMLIVRLQPEAARPRPLVRCTFQRLWLGVLPLAPAKLKR
jgi:hypothetical protein